MKQSKTKGEEMKAGIFDREQVTELLKRQRQICAETARIVVYHELTGEGVTPYDVNFLQKLKTGECRLETIRKINTEEVASAEAPKY